MSKDYPVELLLHNIRSVYNTAAIFRTAECLGVRKIWLSGYTPAPIDRFGRSRDDFHKVALGTEMSVAWESVDQIAEFIDNQKKTGVRILGLEQGDGAVILKDYKIDSPVLLIPGTETTGLELEIKQQCDQLLEIKQVGDKESLNVHAATAIALWQLLN